MISHMVGNVMKFVILYTEFYIPYGEFSISKQLGKQLQKHDFSGKYYLWKIFSMCILDDVWWNENN